MAARDERVESLFHAALELEGEERARFLSSACAGDAELRAEVEVLLELDASDDTRLDVDAPRALALGGPPVDLLVGRSLGPYRLQRRIAAGGMGAVYEATQAHPRRTVAVKVLRPEIASEDLQRRFLVESAFLARLQHPGIAHVYGADIVRIDGVAVPYIAMELVESARTLLDYARERRLGIPARIELFAAVCDAVHHGHQRGVIHRDLKPANVLVDGAGRPKLIDFGIARAVDPEAATRRTATGMLLGTVQYMSPEQCADASDLDVRSDVYSLGVTLYELLCGELPFDFAGVPLAEAARIVRDRPPRRPATVARGLRGDLETILLKALEKDRRRRYQSAAELGDDLRRYLRREPIAARAPSLLYRSLLFARRNRAGVAVVAVAVIAALVSARFAVLERGARLREQRSSDLANLAAADLSLRAYDAPRARRRLEQVPAERRGFEWWYLWRQLDLARAVIAGPLARCETIDLQAGRLATGWHYPEGQELLVLDARTGAELWRHGAIATVPTRLAFAPGGAVVFGGVDGSLRRCDAKGAELTAAERHSGVVTAVCVGPDGRVVSASADGAVRVWDPRGGGSRVLCAAAVPWRDLALSPDGTRVALGGEDGSVRVLALATGAEEIALSGHAREVRAVAFHPGGARLASGSADGTVRLWDLGTGGELRRLVGHAGEVHDLTFLPGGDLLVSASTDRTLRVWDVEAGETETVLYGHEGPVKCVAVSDDGELVASGGYDGTVRLWDPRVDPRGRRLEGHGGYVRDVAFSPDGRLVATASFDGTARLFTAPDGALAAALVGHADRCTAVAFDPMAARRRLATASNDGTVRLWDASSGAPLRVLADHRSGVLTLAFAADGSLLATGSRDGRLLVYEAEHLGRVAEHVLGCNVEQIAFDPTGPRIAVVTQPAGLSLRDARSGEELWRRTPPHLVHDVAFSPDGTVLAVGSGDFDGKGAGVVLHDACDGQERGWLRGHTGVVVGLAFSPDGARLASASADGTIRLWEPRTGEEVLVLHGHEGWVWAVAFSGGGLLVSGAGNPSGTGAEARLWDGRPAR